MVELSLNVVKGLLTGSALRGAIAAVCGTAFLVSFILFILSTEVGFCSQLVLSLSLTYKPEVLTITDSYAPSFLAMIKESLVRSLVYHHFAPTSATQALSSKAPSPLSMISAVS